MENIRPIRNDEDLAWAVKEVSHYFDNQPDMGTPECDRFDVLSDLIEAYETKHYPIESPDPIELVKAFMEANGYSQKDFAAVLGSPSRASEVLRKRRPLNLDMIRKISSSWNIPAEPLVAPYHLAE